FRIDNFTLNGYVTPIDSSVYNSVPGRYRYGFNGKENDNEVKGEGNQQDYGMRVYDPRIGKFLSVDPLSPEYPELTPYQFASNRPIDAVDIDGAEAGHWDPVRGVWMAPSDAIRHPLPPGAYMPSAGAAEGGVKRNWALEAAAPFAAAGAVIADGSAGFPVMRTVGTVLTVATVADLYSSMHIAGNAKDPIVKEENEAKAKQDAIELAVVWGAGKAMNEAGNMLKSTSVILSKSERLGIFINRLKSASAAKNQEEALKLINSTLDKVEDAYSGVPKAPGIPNRDDGRMYGILDKKYVITQEDGTMIANTKGNRIILEKDGGFKIQSKDGTKTFLDKPGTPPK
ncbi:RHS repeat domain-containing protein, partial [Chitinophaga sp. 30R24]|uniref:RHS repeat domain-containing protein n=1 Tax=Chitinophaga sp. 30R24 TaxID=3248838 RepID=UPI003B903845